MINLFPKTYKKATTDFILNQLKQKNKISVQYLYGVGKNVYFQYLSYVLQKSFGNKVFNLSISNINGNTIKTELSRFISESDNLDTISKPNHLQHIRNYFTDNDFLILNLQFNYLDTNNSDLLNELAYINTLRNTFTNQIIPIIHYYWRHDTAVLLHKSIVRELFDGFNIKFKAFNQNTFNDALYYFQKRNRQLTKEEQSVFWQVSAGQPVLYKQFFLFCIENELSITTDSFDDFVESQRLLDYKSKLISDFGDELTSTLQNNTLIKHPSLKDLQQFGLIDKNNDFYSKVLAKVFAHHAKINNHKKVIINDIFTKIESDIVNTLSNNPSIVSRDKIASIIWGDKNTENYSNYAIDKHISNIRTKLKSLNLGEIKTMKGRGYKLIH